MNILNVMPEYGTRKRFEVASLACPCCNKKNKLHLVTYPDKRDWFFVNLAVIACGTCGFSHVPINPFGLNEYYRSDYSASKGRVIDVDPNYLYADKNILQSLGIKRTNRHLSTLEKYVSTIDTIVDVGCGYGLTLDRSIAKNKIGVEIDPVVTRFPTSRGIKIVNSIASIPDAVADVVICSHVIEHIHISEVVPYLNAIKRIMKPSAICLLEVPNAPLLHLNLTKCRHSPHLNFFSMESLRVIIQKSDLSILAMAGAGDAERQTSRIKRYKPLAENDVRTGALLAILAKEPQNSTPA